jgi:hypothetical protein
MIAKPISINGTGGKSGGCARKAVDLTAGDPLQVAETRLRRKRFLLILPRKSAKGKVGRAVGKAIEALQSRKAEQQIGGAGNDESKA